MDTNKTENTWCEMTSQAQIPSEQGLGTLDHQMVPAATVITEKLDECLWCLDGLTKGLL